jgi:hypothetical protein
MPQTVEVANDNIRAPRRVRVGLWISCRWSVLTFAGTNQGAKMIIDCDSCEMRDIACDDCVVTALLATPPHGELADDEAGALQVLAEGGLVPPLRMQPGSGLRSRGFAAG